ncbi:hypothetical protein CY0110_18782 [Crocosphaera chwakensis CCY0110]|uniref:Uncharacterized protein n=1 Tax=Crocosphaera chwakensis CCY0110 TaxID=391612 RepID=A3IJ88_9CHRO|nr:hypothetical protein CY0110_18782 [Crocosphaera chwakensis CCY0110]
MLKFYIILVLIIILTPLIKKIIESNQNYGEIK